MFVCLFTLLFFIVVVFCTSFWNLCLHLEGERVTCEDPKHPLVCFSCFCECIIEGNWRFGAQMSKNVEKCKNWWGARPCKETHDRAWPKRHDRANQSTTVRLYGKLGFYIYLLLHNSLSHFPNLHCSHLLDLQYQNAIPLHSTRFFQFSSQFRYVTSIHLLFLCFNS